MISICYDKKCNNAYFEEENFGLLHSDFIYICEVHENVVEALIVGSYLNHDMSYDMLVLFIRMAKKDLKI